MSYWAWMWLGFGGVALMALLWECWICLECWWNARKSRKCGKAAILHNYTSMEL